MEILIAGDFCPIFRVKKKFIEHKYAEVLGEVAPLFKASDYSILNFEGAIIDGITAKPIEKCGPNLGLPRESIDAMKFLGVKGVTLANNHFADFGDEGVFNTINEIKSAGIDYVGGGGDIVEAQKVLCKEINGQKVAFVNVCENEFTIASEHSAGSAPIDLIDVFKQILIAKKDNDFIIVVVHGGHEHYQLPSPRMKKTYRWLVDIGADTVINHHQHCYSGYEVYKGKPIFYGLGNFCFDKLYNNNNESWFEGYMVKLKIGEELGFDIIPYYQCKEEPKVKIKDGDDPKFLCKLKKLNHIIYDDSELEKFFFEYCNTSFQTMKMCLSPYNNRILLGLCRRGLIPSFVGKNKIMSILNYTECESHRDVFISFLKHF